MNLYNTLKSAINQVPGAGTKSSYEKSQNSDQYFEEKMEEVNQELDRARAVNDVMGKSMERFLDGSCEGGYTPRNNEELEGVVEEKILRGNLK